MEDHMHAALEGPWGVLEAKGHDVRKVQAKRGDKGGLPMVFRLDPDVVIPPTNVKGSEKLFSFQLFQNRLNAWERVYVRYGPFVDLLVILDWAEGTILLFYKEEQGSPGRVSLFNVAQMLILINSFARCFHLSWAKRISFTLYGGGSPFL
jgi:hypothetical protein